MATKAKSAKSSAGPRALTLEGADKAIKKGLGENLTERESEILMLLSDGNTNKEVATKLRISYKTVDTHRTNLMRKLAIHSITGLVKFTLLSGRGSIS
ncbi:MAG: response regulator transcription factor [Planctomycetes bacterium]|nr:response regulator transcription factor [Planctomycetota bacterium]